MCKKSELKKIVQKKNYSQMCWTIQPIVHVYALYCGCYVLCGTWFIYLFFIDFFFNYMRCITVVTVLRCVRYR
jgi:hypothetical protein